MVTVIKELLKLEFLIQLGHYAQLKDYQSKFGQEAKKKKRERKKLVHQYRICVGLL